MDTVEGTSEAAANDTQTEEELVDVSHPEVEGQGGGEQQASSTPNHGDQVEAGSYFAEGKGRREQTKHHHKIIPFKTVFHTPPSILLGLNYLDFSCRKNIRTKLYADEISRDYFHIHGQSWASTIVYGLGCDWMALPENVLRDRHIEIGSFNTLEDHGWREYRLETTKQVKFDRAYGGIPTVAVWLNSIDMNNWRNQRVHVTATDITPEGFTLNIKTWGNSILHSAGASWFAYDPNMEPHPRIQVGEFFGKEHGATGVIRFTPGVFGNEPPRNVMVVLNKIDVYCWKNMRIRADSEHITSQGMVWRISTWNNSHIYGAGGVVIAMN
ncbi:hypothetical protein DFH27DRAFT_486288 [Peziza echinospora]|nr:hypothetical protein DFH27DRAFT_486288 [Peziza echinospora]